MEKYKILSVKERKCFDVEIEVREMDSFYLTLEIREDGSIQPIHKTDWLLIWQLKLIDEQAWRSIKEQIKEKSSF